MKVIDYPLFVSIFSKLGITDHADTNTTYIKKALPHQLKLNYKTKKWMIKNSFIQSHENQHFFNKSYHFFRRCIIHVLKMFMYFFCRYTVYLILICLLNNILLICDKWLWVYQIPNMMDKRVVKMHSISKKNKVSLVNII